MSVAISLCVSLDACANAFCDVASHVGPTFRYSLFLISSIAQAEPHLEPTRIACSLTLVSFKTYLLSHSYIASSSEAKHAIKRKWRARLLKYAKNLIRLQTNVKEKTFKKGDVIYREGDQGKSMVSRKIVKPPLNHTLEQYGSLTFLTWCFPKINH